MPLFRPNRFARAQKPTTAHNLVRAALTCCIAIVFLACGPPGTGDNDDQDQDGYQNIPAGGFDCNDLDASIHPDATEICDGLDQNCNGQADDGALIHFYPDEDQDGAGDRDQQLAGCIAAAGFVLTTGDCDDTDATISPGAPELCDGRDNNCNDTIDENGAQDATTYFADNDNDGWGAATSQQACSPPPNHVTMTGDCNDNNPTIHPGATESDCNDPIDSNCDGQTGPDDHDGDGFGACQDCNDSPTGASVFPGADEQCNNIDDNCDSRTDEDYDADNDGALNCDLPGRPADCNDNNNQMAPHLPELPYDGIDQDCSGTDLIDQDNDGVAATQAGGLDCDDQDPATHPKQPLDPMDGIDRDCDGLIDEGPFTYSHATHIQPIWNRECLTNCHSGSNPSDDLNLGSTNAYRALRAIPSFDRPTLNQVEPGSVARSYLWHKLTATHLSIGGSGAAMPKGAPLLSQTELNKIEQWILEGAPP